MKHEEMLRIVKTLEFDKKKVIITENGTELFLLRPSKLSKRFKTYDIKKNFQIWLREGTREFRPNHLRIFIDLNLRARSRPDLKKQLLQTFDDIFYHGDPDIAIKHIKNEKFEHSLNSLKIIACLTQLFIIEQEYCYHKISNYNPPTLFFQGWIRTFIDSPKEIDNLCMSVANRQPPKASYTNKENKKDKNYQKSLKPLWYLNR